MNYLQRTCSTILRKSRLALILAIAAILITSIAFAGPLEDCKEYSRLGIPSKQGKLLCRKGFLLAYSSEHKTPLWVIESLTADKAKGNLPINGKYQPDPDLKKGEQAELDDYKNSNYKMGQMALAATMKWDQKAMEQSFYLSNMIPQMDGGMNRGIWKLIEERIRDYAINREAIYIFTGPIYEDVVKKTIGSNKVAIPSHIFKIIYDPYKVEARALIIPNEELDAANYHNYFVTIRDIERKTGLNFLSKLNEKVHDIVDNQKAQGLW